ARRDSDDNREAPIDDPSFEAISVPRPSADSRRGSCIGYSGSTSSIARRGSSCIYSGSTPTRSPRERRPRQRPFFNGLLALENYEPPEFVTEVTEALIADPMVSIECMIPYSIIATIHSELGVAK